jgi:hypothetical protein
MPLYTYENPVTKQRIDIVQTMSEPHEYSEDGIPWTRVFAIPNAKIDGLENVDPFNKQEFINKTARKGMTVGDMWDESQRLSDKRTQKAGKDEVREKAEKAYKHRTGKEHPHAAKPKPKYVKS